MRQLSTDVLVIGAGPAGCATARVLAASGRDVLLVDRCEFPRDKVCGDGLIPDALHALDRLRLTREVLADSRRASTIRVYAPNGRYVAAGVDLACLPRRRFDALMREGAVACGARFAAPYELRDAIEADGCVAGARFRHRANGEPLQVKAAFTVLATGAAVAPLEILSVCERRLPSAIAARVYVRAPRDIAAGIPHFLIWYGREIAPGYGWIFPGPDDVFNVGVAYFTDGRRLPATTNLRALLDRFVRAFPAARQLMAASERLTDLRGAPLRTALTGSAVSRPGLLVVGEACGATYSLTGEGIGKAMESGILAAEVLAARANGSPQSRRHAAREYAATLQARLHDRFRAYRIAQNWICHPLVHDFLAWRGNAGTYVAEQLQALLCETSDPRTLFSLPGVLKALVL